MSTFSNQNYAKLCKKYSCFICDYETSRKSSFDNHLLSTKHQKSTELLHNGNQIMQNYATSKFACQNCNKEYKDKSGLWRHSKKCNNFSNYSIKTQIITNNQQNDTNKDDLIIELLKQNKELIEIMKNGTYNNSNNTTTHTNSHNKAFNLQFFLNETCKDAMNIMDFVESIKLELSDLENVGEVGYIEGISNIIVKNLKELDITKRPVHCTDKKRETMYIKDENKWEKDEENTKLHKLVKKITHKNQRLLPKFKEEHPDCLQYHSKYSDQYSKIVYESMGGKGDDDYEKEEKIIKKIVQNVVIEK
jgi:hypothetical protein